MNKKVKIKNINLTNLILKISAICKESPLKAENFNRGTMNNTGLSFRRLKHCLYSIIIVCQRGRKACPTNCEQGRTWLNSLH